MSEWQLFIAQAQSQRMVNCEMEGCNVSFPFNKANPRKRFCCDNHQEIQRGRDRRAIKRMFEDKRSGKVEA